MALREARRDEVRQIVEMLLDDELGKTREDPGDLTPYLKGFDAITADPRGGPVIAAASELLALLVQRAQQANHGS